MVPRLVPYKPDPATLNDLTPLEQDALEAFRYYTEQDSGYSKQQSTRPQTLGYGLTDSPAGQAAWILEKFRAWTDCDGHPENVLTRDELRNLPNTFTVDDIIGTTAGTVVDSDGQLHVRGGRDGTNSYYFDDIPVQDPFYGIAATRIAPDALEELDRLRVGCGLAAFNVRDSQRVEQLSDHKLVVKRTGDPFSLRPVPKGGIIKLDFHQPIPCSY